MGNNDIEAVVDRIREIRNGSRYRGTDIIFSLYEDFKGVFEYTDEYFEIWAKEILNTVQKESKTGYKNEK